MFEFFSTLISSLSSLHALSIAKFMQKVNVETQDTIEAYFVMKCSKISWAASFEPLSKRTWQPTIPITSLLFMPVRQKMQHIWYEMMTQPVRGASFASIATSSPIEVRTITSKNVSKRFLCVVETGLTSVFLLRAEELLNLVTNFSLRAFDIIFGVARVRH